MGKLLVSAQFAAPALGHTQTRRVGTLGESPTDFKKVSQVLLQLYVPKWPDCNRREKGPRKIVREMKREAFVPISEKMPTLEREFNACPCVMFMFLVNNRKKNGRNRTKSNPGARSNVHGMGRSRFGFEGAYLFHSYQFGQMRLTPRRVPSTRNQPAHCLLYL